MPNLSRFCSSFFTIRPSLCSKIKHVKPSQKHLKKSFDLQVWLASLCYHLLSTHGSPYWDVFLLHLPHVPHIQEQPKTIKASSQRQVLNKQFSKLLEIKPIKISTKRPNLFLNKWKPRNIWENKQVKVVQTWGHKFKANPNSKVSQASNTRWHSHGY